MTLNFIRLISRLMIELYGHTYATMPRGISTKVHPDQQWTIWISRPVVMEINFSIVVWIFRQKWGSEERSHSSDRSYRWIMPLDRPILTRWCRALSMKMLNTISTTRMVSSRLSLHINRHQWWCRRHGPMEDRSIIRCHIIRRWRRKFE